MFVLPQKWTKSQAELLPIVAIIMIVNPMQKKVEEKTGYKSRTVQNGHCHPRVVT